MTKSKNDMRPKKQKAFRESEHEIEIPIEFRTEEDTREIEQFFLDYNPRVEIGFPVNKRKLMVIRFEKRKFDSSSYR